MTDFTDISIITHYSDKLPYSIQKYKEMMQSYLNQFNYKVHLFVIDESDTNSFHKDVNTSSDTNDSVSVINGEYKTLGEWLNSAVEKMQTDYFIYVDNNSAEIYLKNCASAVFMLAAKRNSEAGMLYSDYELESDGNINEIKLLKHHSGRLRDNQDYGRVFCFNKKAIDKCGGFDQNIKYNTQYDIRLKLSEKNKLIHISNRYSGSLYKVVAEGKGHNVFDYLLASKESQLEAEEVLSNHLKRTNTYLESGQHYNNRPEIEIQDQLKATIIIPVNNRADFIGTAIESVLNQTDQDIEVIVAVNGGADDPTIDKVHEYMPGGIQFNENKPDVHCLVLDVNNLGVCFNLATEIARGKYYVQLDSDDRLKPDAVQKILQVYESDPKIGIVIGSYEVWEKDDDSGELSRVETIPVVTHDEWTEDNGRNNLLRINGAGAPRSIPIQLIKDIGYFGINDEPFARNYGEDYEMVLKISERHKVGRVWEPIYEVIRHSGGTDHSIDQATIDRNDEAKDYMRLQAIGRRKILNK